MYHTLAQDMHIFYPYLYVVGLDVPFCECECMCLSMNVSTCLSVLSQLV